MGIASTQKAPGKLYIAGEYAVLEKGSPAIAVAVNRFVYAKITPAKTNGTIRSNQYRSSIVHWTRIDGQMVVDYRDDPFQYILQAIKITEQYLVEKGVELGIYDLDVNSELSSFDGEKYGLGSSAAVTVATVKALLAFYGIPLDQEIVFKLAAIAHMSVQKNGSSGDIAASVYGGWIAYRATERPWLKNALVNQKLSALVESRWPLLLIKNLIPPTALTLLVGWSGIPASTPELVDRIAKARKGHREEYLAFVAESRACVERMIAGFAAGDTKSIKTEIRTNRALLRRLENISGIKIEIPGLTKLITIAERFGAAAKTSGAGNGDCGIALADTPENADRIGSEWALNGVVPLDLAVEKAGG